MEQAGERLKDEAILNVLAAAVGALGAAGAYAFRQGIVLVQNGLFFQRLDLAVRAPLAHDLGLLAVALPALGAGAGLLVLYLLTRSTDRGGATTVIEAASFRGGSMSIRDTLGRVLAAMLTLGAGGSAGREGPILILGGAGGSGIGEALGLDRTDRRILIACGATGGVAATFNAPVAAVVFAIEAIFFEFRTESFVPIVVASVFGTAIGRLLLGEGATFLLDPAGFALGSPVELGLVAVLGMVAGLAGVAFLWIAEASDDAFERIPVWSRPLVGGGAMGLIGLALPRLLGVGYGTMQTVLDGALGPEVLGSLALTFAVLMVVKPLAVAATLGGGGSGGVFSPTLFVGIMLGALFGLGAEALLPGLASGYPVYAVLGMVAVFAAVSRATLTAIILVVEFTHNFGIVVPAMLAAVVADVVAWSLHREGLFATRLRERGIHLPHDLSPNVLDMVLVREVMTGDVETLPVDATIQETLDRMLRTGHGGYPVLDADGRLVGVVTRTDMRDRPADVPLDAPIDRIMTADVLVALPDETVHRVLDRMVKHGLGHMPVVREDDPQALVGWMTKTDVMEAEVADEGIGGWGGGPR